MPNFYTMTEDKVSTTHLLKKAEPLFKHYKTFLIHSLLVSLVCLHLKLINNSNETLFIIYHAEMNRPYNINTI